MLTWECQLGNANLGILPLEYYLWKAMFEILTPEFELWNSNFGILPLEC